MAYKTPNWYVRIEHLDTNKSKVVEVRAMRQSAAETLAVKAEADPTRWTVVESILHSKSFT